MAANTSTRKIAAGKYEVTRHDDRRRFVVQKGVRVRGWIIEAQDTFSVDGAATKSMAVAVIANRWSKQAKETD